MLIEPTATATATVASSVPRHRMAITTAKRARGPDQHGHPGHAGHRRSEADERDAEPDRIEDEQGRDDDREAGSTEVVADEPAEERVPVAHPAVAGDALDERGDRSAR